MKTMEKILSTIILKYKSNNFLTLKLSKMSNTKLNELEQKQAEITAKLEAAKEEIEREIRIQKNISYNAKQKKESYETALRRLGEHQERANEKVKAAFAFALKLKKAAKDEKDIVVTKHVVEVTQSWGYSQAKEEGGSDYIHGEEIPFEKAKAIITYKGFRIYIQEHCTGDRWNRKKELKMKWSADKYEPDYSAKFYKRATTILEKIDEEIAKRKRAVESVNEEHQQMSKAMAHLETIMPDGARIEEKEISWNSKWDGYQTRTGLLVKFQNGNQVHYQVGSGWAESKERGFSLSVYEMISSKIKALKTNEEKMMEFLNS